MAEEKKGGPVVVRKAHLRPPTPGEKIEQPVVEQLDAGDKAAGAPKKPDSRPLWQRVAEQAAGAPIASAKPQERKPGGPPRGPRPERGPRREGGRPPRERDERPRPPREPRAAAVPEIKPPPAPEAPAPDEGSFADMFAAAEQEGAGKPRRRFQVGERVAGKIIHLGDDVAFLDLGGGAPEGMIAVAELKDKDGNLTAQVNDIVDAVVVKASDRGVEVAKHVGRNRELRHGALVDAARTGLPVEGVVKAVNKGGLEVEVMGERAFCPMSQVDVRFVADLAPYVGQKLEFKVTKADGRDAVLSRRALLEEERGRKAEQTRERLKEGEIFEGTVTSVRDFGAFVDIGGVEGLVHVSELAWDRVKNPAEVVKAGDAVRVQVTKIEQDAKKGERISLSVRSLLDRPEPVMTEAAAAGAAPRAQHRRPQVGDVVDGTIDKIEPFGLFVSFPGGRGLVPAAETGTPHGADLRKAFKAGEPLRALIIDMQGDRIRLSKSQAEEAVQRAEAREYMKKNAPRGGKGFGTSLGDLLRAKLEGKDQE